MRGGKDGDSVVGDEMSGLGSDVIDMKCDGGLVVR